MSNESHQSTVSWPYPHLRTLTLPPYLQRCLLEHTISVYMSNLHLPSIGRPFLVLWYHWVGVKFIPGSGFSFKSKSWKNVMAWGGCHIQLSFFICFFLIIENKSSFNFCLQKILQPWHIHTYIPVYLVKRKCFLCQKHVYYITLLRLLWILLFLQFLWMLCVFEAWS